MLSVADNGGRKCPAGTRFLQENAMRVEVDLDRCEGNAICVGIDPDLFELNDDEQAEVKVAPIPADREAHAMQAIAECPRAALRRVED
jgi:ferredoxin